jgi:heme-degrading monooxygenase HmoA
VIARTWHGRVPAPKADEYFAYLQRTGIPDYQRTPGNRGVYVFRRIEGGEAHFLLTSLWESLEAIRAFAGEDLERARYYPEDTAFLLELEPKVMHYEVLVAP